MPGVPEPEQKGAVGTAQGAIWQPLLRQRTEPQVAPRFSFSTPQGYISNHVVSMRLKPVEHHSYWFNLFFFFCFTVCGVASCFTCSSSCHLEHRRGPCPARSKVPPIAVDCFRHGPWPVAPRSRAPTARARLQAASQTWNIWSTGPQGTGSFYTVYDGYLTLKLLHPLNT